MPTRDPFGRRQPGDAEDAFQPERTHVERFGGRRATRPQDRRLRGRARRQRFVRRRRTAGESARTRLRFFRQASIVAVAVTGFLLLLFAPEEAGIAQEQAQDTVVLVQDTAAQADTAPQEVAEVRADTLVRAARDEARRTARNLWFGFLGLLPKLVVVLVILLLAGLLVRIVRPVLRWTLGQWERGTAAIALAGIVIWLLAIGISVSVLAGDIRALLGSLGLVGLALSWALQTPIESFTGWLMNNFKGYYRVGDRVAVGDVFGDVYRIDFLTTTVWEAGSIARPGFVNAEQPTGRLITFPNSEVLSGSIVNLTRDFAWVWDELAVPVANRSDLAYAADVVLRVAREVIGDHMRAPAEEYERVLRLANLERQIAREPEIYISLEESWTNLTVRYLVGARERRVWKSRLAAAVQTEINRPEHGEKILSAYPRRQIQVLDADELPVDVGELGGGQA